MQILSFDTSGNDIQIALMQDGQIIFAQKLQPEQKNRQEAASILIPVIDAALKKLAWRKKQLDMLVVGVGPGSFTGVRIAVIAARTIGQALALPVFPVSSLDILARQTSRPCAVVLNAGSGKFYAGVFSEPAQASSQIAIPPSTFQPFCGTLEELEDCLSGVQNLVLENNELAAIVNKSQKTNSIKDSAILVYPADANLAAEAAAIAYDCISENAANFKREELSKAYPWDNVVPLYLRNPSVTLKASDGSSIKTIASG